MSRDHINGRNQSAGFAGKGTTCIMHLSLNYISIRMLYQFVERLGSDEPPLNET